MEKDNIIKVIESLSVSKEIEKLKMERDNVLFGRPRKEGIKSQYNKNDIVPENKKAKTAKQIESNIEELQKVNIAIKEFQKNADLLEATMKKIRIFKELNRQLSSSAELTALKNNDAVKKLMSKCTSLIQKDISSLEPNKIKYSIAMYKMYKKIEHKKVDYKEYGIPVKQQFEIYNIHIEDKYTFGSKISNAVYEKYINSTSKLSIDTGTISYAKNQLKENNINSVLGFTAESYEKLKKLNYIRENYHIKVSYAEVNKMIEKYKQINELSQYLHYTEQTLEAFKNTEISNSVAYLEIQNVLKAEKNKLLKLQEKAAKLFEKSSIKNKIAEEARLNQIQKELEELERLIEESKNQNETYRLEGLKNEYNKLKYEMEQILEKNPDLTLPEYSMPKKNIKEENIRKEDNLDKASVEKTQSKESDIVKEETQNKKEYNIPELEGNLQIQRSAHYQNYMKEKVMQSPLGQISFSEYLIKEAPDLKDLIAIEQTREKYAKPIFKEYMKYMSSLENKANAMDFESFAQEKYRISTIDMPIEYEKDLDEGMKR